MKRTQRNTLFLLAVMALAGILYLWFMLPNDVGVGADTVIYYAAAQSLLDGHGLTMPFSSTFAGSKDELMTHFPPFYSIILASLGWITGSVATGAWLLSVLAFGVLVFLVGFIMQTYCPNQPWIAILAAFLTLTSGAIIRLHTVALSEPVFILCWLSGLFLLDRHLSNSRRRFWLLSAILLGASFLTRFSGLAFIGTACLWLLYRRGWKTAVPFGILAILPMGAWMLYSSIMGSATNRSIAVHWISAHHFWQGVYTIAAWFSPDILPQTLRVVVWVCLLVCFAWLILKRQLMQTRSRQPVPDFFKLLLISIATYTTQIVLSISFLDVQVRLSPRILSPVFLCVMMTLLYGISVWWPSGSQSGRRVMMAVFVVLCLAYLTSAVFTFSDIQQNGEHYTSVDWRDSETVAYLQTVDGRTPYVTNGPDVIYYYTGLPIEDIPAQFHDTSLLPNEQYEMQMVELAEQLKTGTQLVYFHNMQWRWFLPSHDTVTSTLPLRPVQQFDDGTIYIWDGE